MEGKSYQRFVCFDLNKLCSTVTVSATYGWLHMCVIVVIFRLAC